MTTYYIDPINGNDGNAGDSFATGHPFKTLKKTFAAGDTVLVAKAVETGQAGTATVTKGSNLVATTSDLSAACPQYSVLRFDTDNSLYMVKSITSSQITLYRPYRGTGRSGAVVNKLGTQSALSNDWVPTAGTGTAASPILLQGGINTSSLAQDGFTLIYGPGSGYGLGALNRWNFSKMAFQNFQDLYKNDSYWFCEITDCFGFQASRYGISDGIWSSIINQFVFEKIDSFAINRIGGCTVTGLEMFSTAQCIGNGGGGNIFYGLRQGVGSAFISYIENLSFNKFYDAVFSELTANATADFLCNGQSTVLATVRDLRFINCLFGANPFKWYSTNRLFHGEFSVEHFNNTKDDNRIYQGIGDRNTASGGALTSLTSIGISGIAIRDDSVYNTVAPSVKVQPNNAASGPYIARHVIPCDGGVAKTISVYLRKNSSYGSSTLPKMRLKWFTGTLSAPVRNQHDVAMTDTNNTWIQVSYQVTPAFTGVIEVEIHFQSAGAGAAGYYCDFGAV